MVIVTRVARRKKCNNSLDLFVLRNEKGSDVHACLFAEMKIFIRMVPEKSALENVEKGTNCCLLVIKNENGF